MEFFSKYFKLLTVKENEPTPDEGKERTADKDAQAKTKSDYSVYGDVLADEECGYDLYPERRGEVYKSSVWNKVWNMQGREGIHVIRCEKKLYKVIKEAPLVKLMIGALKSAGCDIDIRRNFSCEFCKSGVNGGYDHKAQQVVICHNNVKSIDLMQAVLTHELIHMYDHCANKTDFTNMEHLACTEIRAANLTGCSIFGAFLHGSLNPIEFFTFDIGKKHERCVQDRAVLSIMAARGLSEEKAREIVRKVFPSCYKDMEPIGRRLRSGSEDGYRAYLEGQLYGYV